MEDQDNKADMAKAEPTATSHASAGAAGSGDWYKWKDDLLTAVNNSRGTGMDRDAVSALARGDGSLPYLEPYNHAWTECLDQDASNTRDGIFVTIAEKLYDALAEAGATIDSVRVRGRGGAF